MSTDTEASSAGEEEANGNGDGGDEDEYADDAGSRAGEESPYPEYLSMTPRRGSLSNGGGDRGGGSSNSRLNRSLFSANGSPARGPSLV